MRGIYVYDIMLLQDTDNQCLDVDVIELMSAHSPSLVNYQEACHAVKEKASPRPGTGRSNARGEGNKTY